MDGRGRAWNMAWSLARQCSPLRGWPLPVRDELAAGPTQTGVGAQRHQVASKHLVAPTRWTPIDPRCPKQFWTESLPFRRPHPEHVRTRTGPFRFRIEEGWIHFLDSKVGMLCKD